jgi:uncharacterized MAPEG superfamily protein
MMLYMFLNFYDRIRPFLSKIPVRYSLEGCVVMMFMVVYLSKGIQMGLSFLLTAGYDNVQAQHRYGPSSSNSGKRDSWQSKLIQRSFNAHLNHWEAFIGFSSAVFLTLITGAAKTTAARTELTVLANAFVVIRVLYTFAYIAAFNYPLSFIRSSIWFAGIVIVVKMFCLAVPQIHVSA